MDLERSLAALSAITASRAAAGVIANGVAGYQSIGTEIVLLRCYNHHCPIVPSIHNRPRATVEFDERTHELATRGGREALLFSTQCEEQVELLRRARRLACADDPLLLEGESGSAKSSMAVALWQWSQRREGPFRHASLSSLDEQIAGSELFGHRRGAFTGAESHRAGLCKAAHGGTLFLDEIAKSSLTVQSRLLELVEDRRIRPLGSDKYEYVDCRIISATNTPLDEAAAKGLFLPDLKARVGFLRLRILPLRERRVDIPGIAEWMIRERVRKDRVVRRPPRLHPELVLILQEYAWPGNLRELAGVLAQMLLENPDNEELTPQHLRPWPDAPKDAAESLAGKAARSRRPTDDEIKSALLCHAGNISRAAESLMIHRATLHARLRVLRASVAV